MQTEERELSLIRLGSIAAFHPKADVCRADISTSRIAAFGQKRNFEYAIFRSDKGQKRGE